MNNGQQTNGTKPAAKVMGKVGHFFANMKFNTILIILGVITALYIFLNMYFGLISFSIYNVGLRINIIILALIWCIPLYIKFKANKKVMNRNLTAFNKVYWGWKIPAGLAVLILLLTILLALFTTPLFMAKSYHNIINVNEEANFEQDIQNYDEMLISVVDKDYASYLGEKKLGDDNLGSQFEINNYTLIYYKENLYWVGAIEPKGFFEWVNNSKEGSPGYVLIDATDDHKEVQIIRKHMKYVPGAYFHQDTERKMYFSNMGRLRDARLNFELDEEGNPYFTQAVYKKKFGATSGSETVGVIALNAVTGESNYYPSAQAPEWIDRVQSTEIINRQLDFWGKYKHGFFNTLFAKKELTGPTGGYNYVYNNNNLYLTTGISSRSTDESIVGMILSDLRTKETNFYKVSGATESAAQKSAQGMDQAQGFKAGYPTLINFNGEPTYLMTLKDASGFVQRYAYVSVKEFNTKRVSATTYAGATQLYLNMIGGGNNPDIGDGDEIVWLSKTISDIKEVVVNGNTTYYIMFSGDNNIYKAVINVDDSLPFLSIGDTVEVVIEGNNILKLRK